MKSWYHNESAALVKLVLLTISMLTLFSCSNSVQPITTAPVVHQTRLDIYVGSRNSSSVKKYNGTTGEFLGNFVDSLSGGLSLTQDLLFISDSTLLVTGINNTTIKKYNAVTGAYLGDFSSGYSLASPTKMSLGKDNLIYVSQWGTTQNKIVRFNLSGAFVGEFTGVGVSNGLGHAWDSSGNFYAASYGTGNNGKVFKFSPAGVLISTFIGTGNIQGPSNLWFGNNGDLFVADWTLGKVQRFDSTGQFKGTFVSGMANVEGYALLPDGNLLLSDWTRNAINKYDSLGHAISTFINTGGLMHPNSISLHNTILN